MKLTALIFPKKLRQILSRKKVIIVEETVRGVRVTISIPVDEFPNQDGLDEDFQKVYAYIPKCIATHISGLHSAMKVDPKATIQCYQLFNQHLHAGIVDDAKILLDSFLRACPGEENIYANVATPEM